MEENNGLESFPIEDIVTEPDVVEGCPNAVEVDPNQPPDIIEQ
jgi:hypothetical protein